MAEWLRRWIVAPTTRVQFSPVTPFLLRARLTASRRPLKPAFEVQFLGPQPLAAGAIGSASDSDSEGSRFEAWAASQSLAGIVQRTGRNATNVQIGVRLLIPVPSFAAGRPIAQDTALRTLKLGLESPLVDQSSRCRPTGEALDCRSRGCGFDSRTPRQSFSGLSSNGRISGPHPEDASSTLAGPATGVSSNWPGSLSFKQRMRDRDPPPLPSFGL